MKENARGGGRESWGLGLLVLFLDDDRSSSFSSSGGGGGKKKKNIPSLTSKAQSIISICVLIVVFTILVFALSTFDPIPTSHHMEISLPRRWLAQSSPGSHPRNSSRSSPWILKKKKNRWMVVTSGYRRSSKDRNSFPFALQGMGALFQRGNRAMAKLLVAHVKENTAEEEFRWFVRTLHRSGVTTQADVVFIFPSFSYNFSSVIQKEELFFSRLLRSRARNSTRNPQSLTGFNASTLNDWGDRNGEPIWGVKNHRNATELAENGELIRGSIVGFEASELDPEGSLAGFLDPVPMQLRRWACYQMLLGRIRRNFKQVLLLDADDVWVLGDVFSRVESRSSEAVHLWIDGKGGADFSGCKSNKVSATASIALGGIRSIRRLSSAMLMEIVRLATIPRRGRGRVSASVDSAAILSHLLCNTSLLKKLKVSLQSIPDLHSFITGRNSNAQSSENEFIIRSGDFGRNVSATVAAEICSSSASSDSFIYTDC